MSVPRLAGDSAQRDQPQQPQHQQPTQVSALGSASATLHIPVSHAFIPFQQFSLTPTETVGLRNPSDDNNNKPVPVVDLAQQQQQLPVVSVVAAVSGLCPPPLPVHSMQQAAAVVGCSPTIIPTVVTPMTVHAAAAAAAAGLAPSTSMPMSNTLNLSNHLSVAAAVSTAAQQQYQALGSTGLNLMTSPAALGTPTGLNLTAPPAAVASAINNLNSSLLANNTTTNVINAPPNGLSSNHSSPSSSSSSSSSSSDSGNKNSSKSSSNSNNSNNHNTTSSKSSSTNTAANNSPNTKTGGGGASKSNSSSTSASSQQNSSPTDATDDLVKPVFKDGELVLEVECGQNKGILYLSKLCQGSKGPCISFQTSWLTPNEFQFVSGRETAKDWKRSIRHHGKSLKLLLAKGILNVHPTMCDCDGCRQGATLTRKGEKRRIPNGDRKPRKLSGGNAGNGPSAGHAGMGAGAGAFRPVGGAPTVASHLASPGGAKAKPEAKRSGGDKQPRITTATTAAAGVSQPPEQSSVMKDAEKANQDITKSQVSAYLDSFNMLSGCKPKPAPAATSLVPLELTSPSADSGACQLTPQSQHSPALSSPASSTSSRSSLCSPTAAAGGGRPRSPLSGVQVSEEEGSVFPVTDPNSPGKAKFSAAQELASPDLPKGDDKSQTVCELNKASDMEDDPEANSGDPTAVDKDTTLEYDIDEGEDSDEESDEIKQGEATMKEPTNDRVESVKEEVDVVPAINKLCVSEKNSGNIDESNESKATKQEPGPTIDNLRANTSDSEAAPKEEQKSVQSSTSAPMPANSNISPALTKPHPYGISALLGPSFSGSNQTLATTTTSTTTKTFSKTEPGCNQTLNAAAANSACTQPLSVSISSNNVKSEHIWVPPTLSPSNNSGSAATGQQQRRSSLDHHSSNSNNHKSSAKSPTTPTSAAPQHHSNKAYNPLSLENSAVKPGSSNTDSSVPTLQQKSQESLPPRAGSSPAKEAASRQHGVKLNSTVTERSALKREHGVSAKPERSGERDPPPSSLSNNFSSSNSVVGSNSTRSSAAHHDREREERHRQRAREERNRKDREREERRERERREEKEAERRRQEEKERRTGSQGETTKLDGSSAAAPGGMAGTGDPSRRPPGTIADAAAFSDYMKMLAMGHGHAMMPPTAAAGYMQSLYAGLRPQDATAAALHSQLLGHPMGMYGPAATAAAGGLPKDASSAALLFPGAAGALTGFGPPPFASLHPLLAARSQYGGAGPTLLDYQRSLAAASSSSSSSSSASASNSASSPYAAWPGAAAAYPYLLPDLMAAASPQAAAAAAAAAAGAKRHSSEMEAAMELSAKRMRLEGRPPEFASPWEYFAAAAASQHHHHQQQQQQQQQQHQHHQQQQQQQHHHQQQQRAAAAFGHPALSCGLESASLDKNSAEYLRKRYLEYAASSPHAAAYLSAALPDYARSVSAAYGQAVATCCPEHRDQDIRLWGVEDVCKFLASLEGCGVYAEHFREQRVDGRILSLLSSEHLVKTLGMKLGPALLLAEAVAKRLQDLTKMAGCEACRAATLSSMQAMQALHPMMSLPL